VYAQFLHNVLFGSLVIGAVVFVALAIIVVRRCFLHIRSGAYPPLTVYYAYGGWVQIK
jgi:hypothetical protein